MKVLITTSTFGQYDRKPLERLRTFGADVITNPYGKTLTTEESLKLYTKDIRGVIAGTEKITAPMLTQAESLKVISRCGVGLDNVDLKVARQKNIKVFRTNTSVAEAVAELTIGFMIDLLRHISFIDRRIRAGEWPKSMGALLRGKVIGLVGLGTVGKRVVELLSGFQCRCLAFDKMKDEHFAALHQLKFVDLKVLMKQSDIVSVHLPLTDETHGLLDKAYLSLMKPTAYFINTARGEIVNEKDLYALLKERQITAAALDVFEQEPYKGKLKELDHVVLTSHIGSYAKESRVAMELEAVENLIKGLKG